MNFAPRRFLLLFLVLALMAAGGAAWALGQAEVARWLWIAAALPVAAGVARDTWAALRGGKLGVDIIALVAGKAYDALKAPPLAVTPPHSPVPFARELESAYLPSPEKIEAAVRKTLGWK